MKSALENMSLLQVALWTCPRLGTQRSREPHAMARYVYVGEIVSFEPDGAAEDVLRDAPFRCSKPISLSSIFWQPCYYATCQVSLCRGWSYVDELWKGEAICTHCASLCGAYATKKSYIFNHPIELHLDHKEGNEAIPPRLIFQVLQVDAWDRHFLEGYAFIDLPQLPGSYDLRGRLWAPRGTWRQRLQAALCGALLPLASPELLASADAPRNRSALRVATGGQLRLRLQVLRHAAAEAPKSRPRPRRTARSLEGLRRRNLRAAAEPSPRS